MKQICKLLKPAVAAVGALKHRYPRPISPEKTKDFWPGAVNSILRTCIDVSIYQCLKFQHPREILR
jgi:hypothetical protein